MSKLLVGSSKSKISGLFIRAWTIKSFPCCPPESSFIFLFKSKRASSFLVLMSLVLCIGSSFIIAKVSSALLSISYTFSVKASSKNSLTVKSHFSWGINCLAREIFKLFPIITFPSTALFSPVIIENNVDLPAPFCPIRVSF